MGFFGRKKSQSAKAGTGDYVAPQVSSNNPARTSSYQGGVRSTAQASDDLIHVERTADPPTSAAQTSYEPTTPSVNNTTNDLEHGRTRITAVENPPTSNYDNNNAEVEAPRNTMSYEDDPSVLSGTQRSIQTYPTVRSAETEETKDSAFTITRNGQYLTLNGFANGHLMRWKFAAEEGPAIIRIPAVFCAIGIIFTTVYPIVAFQDLWTAPNLISAFHTVVLGLLTLILEGRVVGVRNPTNFRARVRGVVTRYLNLLRLLWGRGLLYIFAGSMNLTIDFDWVVYSAFPMMVLGVIAIGAGAHASYNLDRMKSSLTDEAYLWSRFEANDPDEDNKIDLNGFAELLWSLGLEFDDVYTYKAFQQIDRDNDAKVTFEEFKNWWIVTQNDGKKLRRA